MVTIMVVNDVVYFDNILVLIGQRQVLIPRWCGSTVGSLHHGEGAFDSGLDGDGAVGIEQLFQHFL